MEFSIMRAKILRAIKDNEPVPIFKIQDETKLPRSTIIYNLSKFKEQGLVLEKSSEELGKGKELGSPVYIITTPKAKPLSDKWFKALKLLGIK